MSPTLASDAKGVTRPSHPTPQAPRVSLLSFVEEWFFGVSLLGIFIGAAGLAMMAAFMRWILSTWVEWLGEFYGNTLAGTLGGATAGALLALPLVLLMVAFQERKGLALRARIRAALPAWALCAVVMAGVGAIGESIGGWAGWMIGGMLVGTVGGRFLETQ
jgi:hypothetical protein